MTCTSLDMHDTASLLWKQYSEPLLGCSIDFHSCCSFCPETTSGWAGILAAQINAIFPRPICILGHVGFLSSAVAATLDGIRCGHHGRGISCGSIALWNLRWLLVARVLSQPKSPQGPTTPFGIKYGPKPRLVCHRTGVWVLILSVPASLQEQPPGNPTKNARNHVMSANTPPVDMGQEPPADMREIRKPTW